MMPTATMLYTATAKRSALTENVLMVLIPAPARVAMKRLTPVLWYLLSVRMMLTVPQDRNALMRSVFPPLGIRVQMI
jgi:hypothetical protein